MERCKTCKHWEKGDANEYTIQGSGVCHAARQVWDVSETDSEDDYQRKLLPEHAGLLCMVEDGSHYAATLVTMPDFGCVMHEKA